MTDDLVAYLLDDLGPDRRAEVELRLEHDAVWRRELQRLQQCLAATDADSSEDAAGCGPGEQFDEPPRDLVKRTCCYVERACDAAASPLSGAAALLATPRHEGGRPGWSLADFAVGGGVLLTLGMLMMPALRESRDASRRLVCQDNLRALASRLGDYADGHARQLPAINPGQTAGRYAMALAGSGLINPIQLAQYRVCPDSDYAEEIAAGRAPLRIPTQAEIEAARGEQLAQMLQWMGGSYAFILGYRDERGVYHQIPFTGKAYLPMLADAPRLSGAVVRSVNHGGCGQFVVFQDLSVRYRANCDLSANLDNIFLNFNGQHAAGCQQDDIVLGVSEASPDGPLQERQENNIVPIDLAK
jgi:hypothetical protein